MKRRPKEWGRKISATLKTDECRRKRGGDRKCEICGKEYLSYATVQRYCSEKCRKKKNTLLPPIKNKARILGANVVMGKGKTEILQKMIEDAISDPDGCIYCGEDLNLDNLSLDHIEPYSNTGARRQKAENFEYRKKMDRRDNLQIICKNCNAEKGNLNHDEYESLIFFLDDHPGLGEKIWKRLALARTFWSKKKKGVLT